MNNRFKFRVWLPSLNKFGSDNSVFMDCYGKLYGVTRPSLVDDSRSIVNIGQFKEFSGHTIQWYTGLNDKNNNPIYEGDIVSFSYQASEHYIEKEIGKVFFSEGIFYFGKSLFASNDSNFITESIKVIGNMFETPELLK